MFGFLTVGFVGLFGGKARKTTSKGAATRWVKAGVEVYRMRNDGSRERV